MQDLTQVVLRCAVGDHQPLRNLQVREALSNQLADPENQSWDCLGPNEHHNAMQAVRQAFGPKTERPTGNCPRCAGSGLIRAYSHIRGGRCLQCDGTGSIRP